MRIAEVIDFDQHMGTRMHDMASVTSVQGLGEHLQGVVEAIDRVDSAVARQVTAGFAGASILERCVEQPDQVVLTEVGMMAGMYHGRSLVRRDNVGTTTEFITRDPEEKRIDTLYRRLETPSGFTQATVESHQWADTDTTYQIIANEGVCKVLMPVYRRGHFEDVALPLGDGGRGDVIVGVFYAKNLWARASELMLDRSPKQRLEADLHAKELLKRHQQARISC